MSQGFQHDDRGGFLAGEVLETDQLEDIEHWIAVYTELIQGARRMQAAVSTGEERVDEEIQRLSQRLAYWLDRRTRESPGGGSPAPA